MKYLAKNKIPDQTPYVSLSYNGNVSYMPISGSGLPSTIHAEEDGLYIEKNNRIWPMTHPDLSTQPSILPQRFGKLPIYEELIAVKEAKNDCYTSEEFFNKFYIGEKKENFYVNLDQTNCFLDYNSSTQKFYFADSADNYFIDPKTIIFCVRKESIWNIFNKNNYQEMDSDYDAAYVVFVGHPIDDDDVIFSKLIKLGVGSNDLLYNITYSTIFSDVYTPESISTAFQKNHLIHPNPYEDNLYIEDIPINSLIKITQPINRTNIIQASTFNETNYSPITIENGTVTTKLNFKPDYILLQYFGKIDNYYYINSNSSKSLIGNFLMKDLTLKDINDVSDMSQILGIYIGDNAVTGERLFVTAESLLNTTTYKFRASANTLPNNFQSSDFYTSTTNVAGQENKIFAGRAPFATSGNISATTLDWGGESNTEAWLYLINNKYYLDLSDYPALEYASTHNGYLMGVGEGSLFKTNHDAIWNAYTKLTKSNNEFWSWESSFLFQSSEDTSTQSVLNFRSDDTSLNSGGNLVGMNRVLLLITLSKKYTQYFDWITYKWCKDSYNTMIKYCTDSSYGFIDNKTELDLEDDAAYVNWGPAWRMPSYEQFEELINSSYTTTTWTTQNGVNGRKITSKTNGNSIFLPAAGSRYSSSLSYAGSDGDYWSRTCSVRSDVAWGLYSGSNNIHSATYNRYIGLSVRPICTDSSQAGYSYVDLGLPSGTLWATMNIGAEGPEDYGLYFAWGETEGYQ